MSKKNKCVGLDCEMCGNTKCPNEEKETIINGIDVSECDIRAKYFEKNICELGNRKLGELHYLCSENPNCYFKQLKRLEQENIKLKTNIGLMQTALCAIRFSCKLKLEEGQKALHIEPIMRIIDAGLKNE